ncbi:MULTISPECIES: DUF2017 family protein [Actinotignum]|uniref:DUF2017 family protein n=2 Tax=Actinotignum TaxID=1653174 RepID=A0ABU5G9P6_9ACTO|nr:DUF2017 family protein [Actinotignum timonense]MBS5748250.1 DUF2017 family protein [Actinotignum schaalii]MDK6590500.1 DUF2017 family protein [Actinotignum timonense]MDK6629464.1 DUF2017 family protein [Actinotignum timonense]MDY5134686.1 DUF2017 family protein [Actinotignum timonense]MDY5145540.1 DUF2017 family protein [Actinotignum timonense]
MGDNMLPFRPARGGYRASVDATERQLFAGLARDVATLLGYNLDEEMQESGTDVTGTGGNSARGVEESSDVLASYERELADLESTRCYTPANNMDTALARLLPDMSEEPELADELRALTESAVCHTKIRNLLVFYTSLASEAVWVSNEDAGSWLAGANDIRIVLGTRRDITTAAESEAVTSRALDIMESERPQIDTTDDMIGVLYVIIAWWQDSLITAIQNKDLRR